MIFNFGLLQTAVMKSLVHLVFLHTWVFLKGNILHEESLGRFHSQVLTASQTAFWLAVSIYYPIDCVMSDIFPTSPQLCGVVSFESSCIWELNNDLARPLVPLHSPLFHPPADQNGSPILSKPSVTSARDCPFLIRFWLLGWNPGSLTRPMTLGKLHTIPKLLQFPHQ